MLVSALSYGNWITHGSQIEEEAAAACVRAALDAGITTFDTADVYAIGAAESVLGRALKHVRRESVEIFTKVYWPTGPNPNDRGLSRKHIIESLHSSLDRLQTDHVDLLAGAPLRLRRPAGGDAAGLRRPGTPGQGPLHRRLRVDGRADRGRAAPGRRNGLRPHCVQPAAVLADLAGDRGRGGPAVHRRKAWGRSSGPLSPRASSPASTSPGQSGPPGGVAGDGPRGRRNELAAPRRGARARTGLRRALPRGGLQARRRSPWPGCCATRT